MGVSEVLLCPYRCLEYKVVRLEKLKIQFCFVKMVVNKFSELTLIKNFEHQFAIVTSDQFGERP